MRPGHFFVATVGLIGGAQMLDQAFIGGGSNGEPVRSLLTIVLYLYNALIVQLKPGYAAAVGIILFVIIFTATIVQRQLFARTPAY